MTIHSQEELNQVIWNVVHETPVLDIHTHLYDERFGDLLLWGIDELVTYHYLIAEVFRYNPQSIQTPGEPLTPKEFFTLDQAERANTIWRKVFLENSPVSEAARGILTTLGLLGLEPNERELDRHRDYFAQKTTGEHIDDVLSVSNVEAVVMTNDPFDDQEREVWDKGDLGDPRFLAALRVDPLVMNWKESKKRLKQWGYNVKGRIDKNAIPEIHRFLNDWIDRMNPLYMAVSLPPTFDAFDKSDSSKIIQKCILPVCRQRQIPFAMMIGVKKLTNPDLVLAGDSVGKCTIEVVEKLCRDNPDNRFLVTMLSRENQHELCIAARKFANLMPFGCWWYLNDPMTIDEMTRMRLELLGLSFIPQHSDARVLDQLLYKWAHSRWIIALVLQSKYGDLHRTGWRVNEEEIQRDVQNLFGGTFRSFVGS